MEILKTRIETKATFVYLCRGWWRIPQDGEKITLRLCRENLCFVLDTCFCWSAVALGMTPERSLESPASPKAGI